MPPDDSTHTSNKVVDVARLRPLRLRRLHELLEAETGTCSTMVTTGRREKMYQTLPAVV